MTSYCSSADVYAQAPEARPIMMGGTLHLQPGEIDAIIVEATEQCKHLLQGRYSLDVVEAQLIANNLGSIVRLAAKKSALLLFGRYQLGDNAEPRMKHIQDSIKATESFIRNGSILQDDNILLPTINVPRMVDQPMPEALERIFSDGRLSYNTESE